MVTFGTQPAPPADAATAPFGIYSGWLSFSTGSGRTHIAVDRDELERDTDAAMEASRKAVHETAKALERAGDAIRDSTDNS
jgi:hypothetical protein